jgi:hypothetical protein
VSRDLGGNLLAVVETLQDAQLTDRKRASRSDELTFHKPGDARYYA